MYFARTEEQDQLATTLAALLAKRSDSAAVRAAIATDDGFDRSLWQTLCDQIGVAALPVPEAHDGVGASFVETAVALEEVGYALAPSPLLATSIATAALLLQGDEEQLRALLPRIAAGEIGTVVDELTLDGAAATILLAPEGGGLRELDSPGLTPVPTMDQMLRLARVAEPFDEWPSTLHQVAAALTTALQVGTARRGLDMTVAYTKEREQFGRPIGSFQALKHRMADLLVLVEASRSASWAATAAVASYVDQRSPDRRDTLTRRAAVAKAYCSDALHRVAAETVQLHGGIAITWEHDAQLILKRAHSLGQLFGPAREHRGVVAGGL